MKGQHNKTENRQEESQVSRVVDASESQEQASQFSDSAVSLARAARFIISPLSDESYLLRNVTVTAVSFAFARAREVVVDRRNSCQQCEEIVDAGQVAVTVISMNSSSARASRVAMSATTAAWYFCPRAICSGRLFNDQRILCCWLMWSLRTVDLTFSITGLPEISPHKRRLRDFGLVNGSRRRSDRR